MKNIKKTILTCCGAALCTTLLAAQSVQPVLAAGTTSGSTSGVTNTTSGSTSGVTNVTVEFTQANVYINAMPNFDFGTGRSLLSSDAIDLLKDNLGAAARSLKVTSPDAAVPFTVTVKQGGDGILWDPEQKVQVPVTQALLDAAKDSTGKKTETATLTLNPHKLNISQTPQNNPAHHQQAVVPLNLGTGPSSDGQIVLSVSDADGMGRFGVSFYQIPGPPIVPNTDPSATLQINKKVLDPLKDYFDTRPAAKTSPSTTYKHLNLIFPLQWTATITPSSPTP
ncbi:hypothetical protein [Bombilactobacillus bombi]|uniref:hypothetical protein n=1 Tax=Bombilactobacillus bombi TaxID=1303590 RepID=UPI0015E5B50D|nr:hypothetical protein [Bombilactobacillus bombi]MBA1434448.1 hypothetical protein [Bombilactobacillus bombi]